MYCRCGRSNCGLQIGRHRLVSALDVCLYIPWNNVKQRHQPGEFVTWFRSRKIFEFKLDTLFHNFQRKQKQAKYHVPNWSFHLLLRRMENNEGLSLPAPINYCVRTRRGENSLHVVNDPPPALPLWLFHSMPAITTSSSSTMTVFSKIWSTTH